MFTEIVEQLKSCGYTCEAGPLENNTAFIQLEAVAASEQSQDMPVVDEEQLTNHIEKRLIDMGYVPDRDVINLVMELEFEYLQLVGVAETPDE